MTKKKKHKYNPDKALLGNSVYAVRGAQNRTPKKGESARKNADQTKTSQSSIDNGKKMALIEAYAKEHGITIAKAMIHFM